MYHGETDTWIKDTNLILGELRVEMSGKGIALGVRDRVIHMEHQRITRTNIEDVHGFKRIVVRGTSHSHFLMLKACYISFARV